MRFVGLPYIWGGDDPIIGYDCSGLVQELLASVGMDPKGDQTAQSLYNHFIGLADPFKRGCGALVFYGSDAFHITHVAMMVDSFRIIEAGGGGSKTVTKEDSASQNAYIRMRPYDNRGDIVAILMPRYF